MTALFSAQNFVGILTADIFAVGGLSIGILQDMLLILISGLACLYCFILNRRVRGLSNMKTGLGASIVSLTEAIRQTQNAAKDTEVTTLKAIHTLQNLMDEAESTISKLEAKKIDLDRQVVRAAKLAGLQSQLVQRIETDLPNAILDAEKTTANLRKAVGDIYKSDSSFRLESNLDDMSESRSDETSEYAQLNKALSKPPMTEQANIEDESVPTPLTKTSLPKKPTRSRAAKLVKPSAKSKKVTPLKKSKSRDIVNLGSSPSSKPALKSASANKKVAS